MAGAPTQNAEQAPDRGRPRNPRQMARTGAMIAVSVLATLFAVLNLDEVKVHWIIGSGHAPLIIVIVVSVLAGIVLTYLAERVYRKRR